MLKGKKFSVKFLLGVSQQQQQQQQKRRRFGSEFHKFITLITLTSLPWKRANFIKFLWASFSALLWALLHNKGSFVVRVTFNAERKVTQLIYVKIQSIKSKHICSLKK